MRRLGTNPNGLFFQSNDEPLGRIDCAFTMGGKAVADDTQCNAVKGYDGPSGVGAPIGLGLFKAMNPKAKVHHAAVLNAKAKEKFTGNAHDPFPGGKIATYKWVWGDGSKNSHGASPLHAYAKKGHYTLKLTETDNYGRVSTVSVTVVVRKAKHHKK